MSHNDVWASNHDGYGGIWIGNELDYFDPSSCEIKPAAANAIIALQPATLDMPALSGQEINKLYQTTDDATWIGTREQGLSIYRPNSQQLTHLDLNITQRALQQTPK